MIVPFPASNAKIFDIGSRTLSSVAGGAQARKAFRWTPPFFMTQARKELRCILDRGDKGQHIEPNKIKLKEWIERRIPIRASGGKKVRVGRKTLERYEELLRVHSCRCSAIGRFSNCMLETTRGASPLSLEASRID
jgi:hypothetical protein